jgi:hypothetical protein
MSATANGFAHAFSTWIAGGNGLNSGKDGVMRYNSGPMRGMTRDAAQMKFQNEVWKNAAPEWKDEYAKRATTGMLAPSEQKAAASTPTVTPPMRQETSPEVRPIPADGMPARSPDGVTYVPQSVYDEKFANRSLIDQQTEESKRAANKPIDAPSVMNDTPTVSRPMPRSRGLATSQPAFGSRAGTGASETGRVAQVRF